MRATILSWPAAFILIFGLNGLFHTFVAAGLYDPYLHGLMLPMAQANPGFVAGVDAVLVAVMAYFILRTSTQPVQKLAGAKSGLAIGLVAAWTYNFINRAMIPGWPMASALVDILWHAMLGAAGGALMAWVYNALAGQGKHNPEER